MVGPSVPFAPMSATLMRDESMLKRLFYIYERVEICRERRRVEA